MQSFLDVHAQNLFRGGSGERAMRARVVKNLLKFIGIERRGIEQKQLRFFPRWYAGLPFFRPPLRLSPNCGESQARCAGM
jgi:hypothetical protein